MQKQRQDAQSAGEDRERGRAEPEQGSAENERWL